MLPIVVAAIGPQEIIIGLLLVVLLFGASKVPELARSLGKAKTEFQKASREGEQELASGNAATGDEETLKAARELGIPTEGRPIADIERDVQERQRA